MDVTVAVDCMGGDHGPHVTVPAALDFLRQCEGVNIVLVGCRTKSTRNCAKPAAICSHALPCSTRSEAVGMDEAPASALRGKKDSSMRVAVNLVKDGVAHACVSAGNTGALMAISRFESQDVA